MAETQSQGNIETRSDFKNDKKGQHEYYDSELQASFDAQKNWHKQGNKTVAQFLDRRGAGEESWVRLNLFHSNITTIRSMLFGRLPEVDMGRTNDDSTDEVARSPGIILKQILQNAIGTPKDEYSDSLRINRDNRLIPGLAFPASGTNSTKKPGKSAQCRTWKA